MARKQREPRARLALNPAPAISAGAIIFGIMLLRLAWQVSGSDPLTTLVWAFPGVFMVLQPIRGFARGADKQLRVGTRKIDLSGLHKVAVHERKFWGIRHAVATLKFQDRVDEISGLFFTTSGFTRMVEWLAVPVEVLPGIWGPRQLVAQRPDLTPTRQNAAQRGKR